MVEKYRQSFKIQFSETDYSLKIKLYEIMNKMQEASSLHAEILDVGYEELDKYHLGWIISKYKVKIKRYPTWGESITIETWPSGVDKLFAMRSFRIYDEENEHIGSIYSAYMLIDTQKGRLQRISDLPVELPSIIDEEKEELNKFKIPTDPIYTYRRKVNYTDIDLNMHMNNACYVQWIEDCFPFEQHEKMQISSLQVNFISGAKLDEEVIISMYKDEDMPNSYYVQGISEASNKEVFQGHVEMVTK